MAWLFQRTRTSRGVIVNAVLNKNKKLSCSAPQKRIKKKSLIATKRALYKRRCIAQFGSRKIISREKSTHTKTIQVICIWKSHYFELQQSPSYCFELLSPLRPPYAQYIVFHKRKKRSIRFFFLLRVRSEKDRLSFTICVIGCDMEVGRRSLHFPHWNFERSIHEHMP